MSANQFETVLSSLEKFLTAKKKEGIAPDLISRWTRGMETQVLVKTTLGQQVEEKPGRYTDGMDTWWNIRVPKNAASDPFWKDYRLDWPLDLYAKEIGSTGWNYDIRASMWVGFDFDSLVNHAKGIGLCDAELEAVKEKAMALDYVEVRKSTGGNGLHLYVLLDSIPAENHTIHAAIARCALEKMSIDTGFDFASRVDCCGGNMWIWRSGLDADHPGLKLIKASKRKLGVAELPVNWRDRVDVVQKKRSKVRLRALDAASEKSFDGLTRSRKVIALDETHGKLIAALGETGFTTEWVHDHQLLQTHTVALKHVYDSQLTPIKGVFSTSSDGSDSGKPNCFMFPKSNGRWKVFRFERGTSESDLWVQDGESWTTCTFNELPGLAVAAKEFGGVEDPDNGEFVFQEDAAFHRTANAVGVSIELPAAAKGRELRLANGKAGKMVAKFALVKGEPAVSGWVSKGKFWIKGFQLSADPDNEDSFTYQYDNTFRQLVSATDENAGWMSKGDGDVWYERTKDDIKSVLYSFGLSAKEINPILGEALLRPWKLVNLPFQAEYPGDRQWNYDAAQLAYEPAVLVEGESPKHPTWDLVFEHLGSDLTSALKTEQWAQDAHIHSGGDYLKAWVAALFREPFEPLPFLFFFGPENSGKSLFFEAVELLLTKGVVDAFRALSSNNEFNGELANAILCYVDEKDLKKVSGARERMKQWVTGKTISIRKMRTDAFTQANTTHWVQCANERKFCPVFKNDTRITVAFVPRPESDIPKAEMLDRLRAEAPHFLRTLVDWPLPPNTGRLRIPVVENDNKRRAAELNECPLDKFLSECMTPSEAFAMPFKDFCAEFWNRLPDDERGDWTASKISNNLPHPYDTKRKGKNVNFINATWKENLAV